MNGGSFRTGKTTKQIEPDEGKKSVTISKSTTLYAVWVKSVTVTLYANGGRFTGRYANYIEFSSDGKKLTAMIPKGYSLKGMGYFTSWARQVKIAGGGLVGWASTANASKIEENSYFGLGTKATTNKTY